jgi:hypothetical protein
MNYFCYLMYSDSHILTVFKNKGLRKIFGTRGVEVIGQRKLRNEELHNL